MALTMEVRAELEKSMKASLESAGLSPEQVEDTLHRVFLATKMSSKDIADQEKKVQTREEKLAAIEALKQAFLQEQELLKEACEKFAETLLVKSKKFIGKHAVSFYIKPSGVEFRFDKFKSDLPGEAGNGGPREKSDREKGIAPVLAKALFEKRTKAGFLVNEEGIVSISGKEYDRSRRYKSDGSTVKGARMNGNAGVPESVPNWLAGLCGKLGVSTPNGTSEGLLVSKGNSGDGAMKAIEGFIASLG